MPFSPRYRARVRRRRLVFLACTFISLALLAWVALTYVFVRPPSIPNNPHVQFHAQRKPLNRVTVWPFYGFNTQRTRAVSTAIGLSPPFQKRWANRGSILLEFPPVASAKTLFLLKNNGSLHAISKQTGLGRWKRQLGSLAASSPAYAHGVVYITLLARKGVSTAGKIIAISGNGQTRWSRDLSSRSESSPVLRSGRLYVGTEGGEVFALRAADGRQAWKFQSVGAVKGGVAYSDGRIYFGDYEGNFYCVRASDGGEIWRKQLQTFPYGSQFYSTPAVIYGRVYVGSGNGLLYALSAKSGRTAWARQSGDYIYSSPAVATVQQVGPTVFVGLRDGTFKAFDAKSGRTRWKYSSGGKIIGSPTVIDNVVYFSNLTRRTTFGLDTRTGERVFRLRRGGFGGVTTDGHHLFVNGLTTLYALSEK